MNLSAWLTYLETLHPEEIELGLDRVRLVASKLGLDFSSKTVISIAGTNGKGSTSCFLVSLLQAAGKSTGLYSSPHLLKYNERISINGADVKDSVLCHAFSRIERVRKDISLTYFEFGTLAALLIFAESELDYIILEVGLGGRLDAVNIIDADLALITNIALDHTEWLGDTREKIAFEKAGIIRQGGAVIFGEDDIPESLEKVISSKHARLYQSGKDFECYVSDGNWNWQGQGFKQAHCMHVTKIAEASLLDFFPSNAAMALQAMLLLNIDVTEGMLEQAYKQATLTGRFQIIERGYTLVLDVAHNPHAASYLSRNIQRYFPKQNVHILLGMLSNKDSQKTLSSLQGIASSWYVASLENSRGSEAKILYNELQIFAQNRVSLFDSVQEAFHKAEQKMQANDVLLVTGSFYTVADVLELI
ncbi:bifunctional tetrahydrofolate synthase/dihydrofolate synthase [Haliea sp. AH-315-K21]|uniref:Dihydrofolate synthase/folylpolyglutamate synthase n=1 Tax=SAR86 cluster bacterium TaxID=2030880 RepID=A0A2A5CF41_9GAMM|nr:bifunctional tetrahydrofolate synthase/dihydrofolate synthase [Haliea sp. AH-315-K21]MBN4075188.1 bifunctional tetrahydrofolate synthase/dihydrofolate synthase [Gammaproteobacteria bacterium AH-315-E17]PCJ42138.1 MAG: bifunctional tetrahydrofolate synthase/dihydrofolate synthase [SAR86 cluster bacterium]